MKNHGTRQTGQNAFPQSCKNRQRFVTYLLTIHPEQLLCNMEWRFWNGVFWHVAFPYKNKLYFMDKLFLLW